MGIHWFVCRSDRMKKQQLLSEVEEKNQSLKDAYQDDDAVLEANKQLDTREETATTDQWLSRIVLLINIGLLFGKATATYLTQGSSLAIISTLLDSIVDISSGFAVWYASRAMLNSDPRKYPRGRHTLEGISVIFIGLAMGMASLIVFFQSVRAIVGAKAEPIMSIASICILGAAILIKAILYILCRRIGTSSAMVLSTDQINDVLSSSCAIAGSVAGHYWGSADPIAAALVSGYITFSWVNIIYNQMPELSGVSCTDEEYSRILRVCIKDCEHVKGVDSLLAYHSGPQLRVEVHVVVDPDIPSRIVHDDVVTPIQNRLKNLSFVERAFVHADYFLDGPDP